MIRPAWRSSLAWATLLGVTLLSITLDLGSKWAAYRMWRARRCILTPSKSAPGRENAKFVGRFIDRHEPLTVIPHVLDLTLVLNPGAVFGVAPGGGALVLRGVHRRGVRVRAVDLRHLDARPR